MTRTGDGAGDGREAADSVVDMMTDAAVSPVGDRRLPESSPFAGDHGQADAALAQILAGWRRGAAEPGAAVEVGEVVAVLATARVFAALLPIPEPSADDVGPDGETSPAGVRGAACLGGGSGMGVVGVAAPDCTVALPVFLAAGDVVSLAPDTRPWPALGAPCALASLAEGWGSLVLDPLGPAPVFLPGSACRALAGGTSAQRYLASARRTSSGSGWRVEAELAARIADVARGEWQVAGCEVVALDHWLLQLRLAVPPGLTGEQLAALAASIDARVRAEPSLVGRVDSLSYAIEPATAQA